MAYAKSCTQCRENKTCYVLNRLARIMSQCKQIPEIMVTDFDFKCSHYTPIQKQLKQMKFIQNKKGDLKIK